MQWEEEEAIALVEERITAEGPLVPSKLARAFHGVTDLFFFFFWYQLLVLLRNGMGLDAD